MSAEWSWNWIISSANAESIYATCLTLNSGQEKSVGCQKMLGTIQTGYELEAESNTGPPGYGLLRRTCAGSEARGGNCHTYNVGQRSGENPGDVALAFTAPNQIDLCACLGGRLPVLMAGDECEAHGLEFKANHGKGKDPS